MRFIRLLLWFFVGVMLSTVAVFAHAETIAATSKAAYYKSYKTGLEGLSHSAVVCKGTGESIYNTNSLWPANPPGATCSDCNRPGYGITAASQECSQYFVASKVCPDGQNWTLSGANCTRPDCVAPQTRDQADGVCKTPVCPPDKPTQTANGTCVDACAEYVGATNYEGLAVQASDFVPYCAPVGASQNCGWGFGRFEPKKGFIMSGLAYEAGAVYSVGTGTCGTAKEKTPMTPPVLPDKKPPCAASEGVMTSSSGTVACVPEGTPTARKPEIETKKKTETFPDGSKKETTETTTKDPLTGAQTTTSSTTTTGKPDGTAGQAGTPGVSGATSDSGGEDGDGDGQGDGDGDCEGNDCGDGNPYPEVDGLWDKKYPDGLGKVIRDKVDLLKATSLGSLISQLAPSSLPSAGSCPDWSLGFNLGSGMNYGSSAIGMPCQVWDFIKIVFLITSLLAARRIVFGG